MLAAILRPNVRDPPPTPTEFYLPWKCLLNPDKNNQRDAEWLALCLGCDVSAMSKLSFISQTVFLNRNGITNLVMSCPMDNPSVLTG